MVSFGLPVPLRATSSQGDGDVLPNYCVCGVRLYLPDGDLDGIHLAPLESCIYGNLPYDMPERTFFRIVRRDVDRGRRGEAQS